MRKTIRPLIPEYKNRFWQKLLKQCLFAIYPNKLKQQQQQQNFYNNW